jgi:nucleoid DNA-binding protein
MEKHIQYLLNTNLRIIIPDFGAFIIRQKEPLVIVFNELLRYNDGLLIDYLARHENIEKDMAKHQVTEYTENLVKALESGKEVNLEGIGTLHKTGEDKIEFVQTGKVTPKRTPKKAPEKKPDASPADKTVTFEIIPEDTRTAAKTAGEIKAATGLKKDEKPRKAETLPKATKSAAKKPQTPEKKPQEVQAVPVEPAKTQVAQPVKEVPVKEVPVKETETQVPVQSVAKPTITAPPAKKVSAKTKMRQQIIWIVLVVVALVLINVWMIFNHQIRTFFGGRPVADTLGLMVETDTMMEAVTADSMYTPQELQDDNLSAEGDIVTEKPLVKTVKLPVAGEKRYYIVAGCFGDEANADAMVQKLIEKGFSAQKYGKRGNLYCVSYSSFTNRDKAITELEKIRKDEDPDAWLNEY